MPGTGLYSAKAVPTKLDRTQSGPPVGQVITTTVGGLGTADAYRGGYVKNNEAGGGLAEEDYQPAATGSPTEGHAWAASSEYTVNYAWKAADDNLGTVWRAAGAAPQWWEYTPPSPVIFAKVNIRAAYNGSQLGPENFTIEGFDGDDWVVLRTVVGETGWAANELREFAFDNETPYSKYRLYITKAEYDWPTMTETEWFELVSAPETRAIVSHTDDTVTLEGDLSNWLDGHDLDVYDSWDVIQDALDQLFADQAAVAFTAIQYVRIFAGTYDENLTPHANLNPQESNGYTLIIEGDLDDSRADVTVAPSAGVNVFLVACDVAIVRHMTIDGGSVTDDAVEATAGCSQLMVTDCVIVDTLSNKYGILADNDVIVLDCDMTVAGFGVRGGVSSGAIKMARTKIVHSGAQGSFGVNTTFGLEMKSCILVNFTEGVRNLLDHQGVCIIRQCTFYDCSMSFRSAQSTQGQFEFVNNIFDVVDYMFRITCWPDEAAEGEFGSSFLMRNNIWRTNTAFAYDGSTTRTYAQIVAMDLVDAAGDLNEVDPKLVDPANDDFSLEPTSLCRHAGHGSGVVADYLGNEFHPNTPDIGAWSGEDSVSAVAWPATLPQTVDQPTFVESLADVVERSEMDSGPAKVRRRFTSGIQVFQATVTVTIAQAATLRTFFDTTTMGGSLEFEWAHPRTGATARMRFLAPPQLTPRGPAFYVASLALEILP